MMIDPWLMLMILIAFDDYDPKKLINRWVSMLRDTLAILLFIPLVVDADRFTCG
jgi:hypothetical protein